MGRRNVTLRTVSSGAAASEAAGEIGIAKLKDKGFLKEIAADAADLGRPRESDTRVSDLPAPSSLTDSGLFDYDLNKSGEAMNDTLLGISAPQDPDFVPGYDDKFGNAYPQPAPSGAGSTERRGEDGTGLYTAEYFAELVDPDVTSGVVTGVFDQMQRDLLYMQATADAQIALATDMAAMPYDEKLMMIDRDIADTYGKMDDLEKITDFYQASVVDVWKKAAAEGASVNGDPLRAKMAPRMIEIGETFDLANENVQQYLDKIGGVPISQQWAIADSIREHENLYEGYSNTELTFAALVADAQGDVFEKQALWGLADAEFQAERERFISDGRLEDQMEKLDMARQDQIGLRARAINNAKQKAQMDYDVRHQLPPLEQVRNDALNSVLTNEFGLTSPEDLELYRGMFNAILNGEYGLFQTGATGRNGEPLFHGMTNGEYTMTSQEWLDTSAEEKNALRAEGWVPDRVMTVPNIRTVADLEAALAGIDDPAILASMGNDANILMSMMDVWVASESAHVGMAERLSSSTAGGGAQARGGQAPNNLANKDLPEYRARNLFSLSMSEELTQRFPGIRIDAGTRPESMREGPGRDPNSDHLSGGAMDIYPTIGYGPDGQALMREVLNYIESMPEWSFTRWGDSNHTDHAHVSWLLAPDVGGGAYAYNLNLDQGTQDAFGTVLGEGSTYRPARRR